MDNQDWLVGTTLNRQTIDRWLAYAQAQVARAVTYREEVRLQLFEHAVVHRELVWRQDHPREDTLEQEA